MKMYITYMYIHCIYASARVYVSFWNKELIKLDKAMTIQSQIMMKLKPMKSPSTPPQSATREPKEKASSSLITWIESLPNDGARLETGRGYLDFSMICNRKRGHHVDVLFA